MKSILRRLILILKAWLNTFLSSAEDPREVFAYAHQRQRELLDKVRQAQMKVASSKRQLQSKTADARSKLPELEGQARQALIAGREDQARFALQLRQLAESEVQTLDVQARELEQEERSLTLVEHRLATQIEAFFARQEVLEVRYSTAEAQGRISEALGGVSEELDGLGVAVERAEQRTEDMQARVSAIYQLVELGVLDVPGRAPGDSGLPQLACESDTEEVEERLAALKREVGDGGGVSDWGLGARG